MRISQKISLSAATIVLTMLAGAAPALAEPHEKVGEFGSFTNPNGIAVEESTGDVYVADIATNTVSKFDANGNPVEFSALHSNTLSGGATPAGSFSFPNVYGNPAAIAFDNSTNPSDASRGDLYVMDLGHNVIDKFSPTGAYLAQITGPFEGEPLGLALTANGDLRVAEWVTPARSGRPEPQQMQVALFDNAAANDFIKQLVSNNEPPAELGTNPKDSFALGLTGDYYYLAFGRSECGCVQKLNSVGGMFGLVDSGPGDVAMAVDPVSGHLYVDEQSSVAELDTGGMDGYYFQPAASSPSPSAALVSSFGSLQLSGVPAQQGGIAVNGSSGKVYVSNPANGKVYVFANTVPGVAAGAAANVSQTGATLQGSVDPRDVPVTSCEFEYTQANNRDLSGPVTVFANSVPCAQSAAQIGSGTSPVGVSADISGLVPGVLYYFRLAVANANGTSASEGMVVSTDAGFGIKSFSVAFLNANGTPDTQAGSHPNQMVTSFEFNTTDQPTLAGTESPYELRPVGTARDIIVTPPPGLVGDPNATEKKCTPHELDASVPNDDIFGCPPGSQVGEIYVRTIANGTGYFPLYNMVPPRGVAAQFGTKVSVPDIYIGAGLKTGEQYPLLAESLAIPATEPLFLVRTTLFGVVGSGESRKPFLTMPTSCKGPLRSTIEADSYQEPGRMVAYREPGQVEPGSLTRNVTGEPMILSGCSKLTFPATITVAPDVSSASSSSGLTVGVHVPQTAAFNPNGLGESSLRDTTVALPAGVAINPAGADGLQACSEVFAGFTGFKEFNPEFEPGVKTFTFTPAPIESLLPGVSFCPNGSKIGTVKIKTPLLPNALEGAVYLAEQNVNPFGSLIAMYMLIEDPVSGSTVKLAGEVRLCENTGEVVDGVSCQAPGQIITTFKNTPDLPFEDLELHFYGGERAPLTTPSRCGTYTTQAIFTPWDGNAPVETSSSFQITSGPNGSPCPGQSLPFNPTLTGGTTNVNAGAFSPFTLTMTRKNGEQNLQSVEAHLPPGLLGILSNIELCGEPQANLGECPPNSLIGETTVSVGVGNQPFTVSGGKFYLTGPYNGTGACTVGQSGCAPFGITFEVPAKAGPFDLKRNTANPAGEDPCDCVIVRGKIEVNPITAAITITSNPPGTPDSIPTSIEGIPLEIQHVNAITTRGDFQFNPTNCNKMQVSGTIHSSEGSTDTIAVPFQVTNCAVLGFKPGFKVSTSGKTSRANGASLNVKLTYPKAPFGSQTNIKSVKVDLPKQLPSRLTTLQKACPAKTFEANPAGCPADSIVGHATAITPLIPVPLTGPAYFVSYGGAKFPELVIVLQGYNVTLDLHGETFISKAGITSSTFHTIPDAPVGSFELNLPEGKYSALAANGNLCGSKLAMPTAFTAQNGVVIHESTKIGVTGCPKKKAKKTKASHHAKPRATHKKK
jgi:hypothetical protein